MEQQQTGKRSAALPITLILLVFSLIGNVFLYSQALQRQQDSKFETGKTIYEDAMTAGQFFEELSVQLDTLIQSRGMEERQAALVMAGMAIQKRGSLLELAAAAKRLAPDGTKIDEEAFASFAGKVDAIFLQPPGAYEGPLKDTDREKLNVLKEYADRMAEAVGGLNASIADNRTALIRLAAGADWLDRVAKLQQLIGEYNAA
ncbi:hypothetical protein KP806_06010 [Paenibacillus sp. N4]|uniref:hypothetical protein n=1 Tax=Paenibacillus vietnamensis TaxID=2590547 RepID=UPI001CD138B2|nr:hypothetical protein [Paenibacillus vietnamensis]MCA0754598.1 hypothetical protein [Paenibacillus vietnamensis]